MSKKLNFIDLFAGAGGLSCGFMLGRFNCLLGVDTDKNAMKTFAFNHPNAQIFCGDITQLKTEKIRILTNHRPIHVIAGGPPCQGFSTVGAGNPNDHRNSLFLQFVRIVKDISPSYIVIENVTGLLAKKNEQILLAIFKKFAALGYHLDAKVLSSDHYGVPEIRRRTIIIGTKTGQNPLFPLPTHNTNRIPAITIGEAFKSLKCDNGKIYNHDKIVAQIKNPIDFKRIQHIPEGHGIRYQKDEINYLPKKLHLGINWNKLREHRFRQTKYLRLDRKKPSPTILTHRHCYFHPTLPRFLTQREAAKLQSFPNDFVFQGPISSQWKQIGNAVPPLMAKAIGDCLYKMYKQSLKFSTINQKKSGPIKKRAQSIILEKRKEAFNYKLKIAKDS